MPIDKSFDSRKQFAVPFRQVRVGGVFFDGILQNRAWIKRSESLATENGTPLDMTFTPDARVLVKREQDLKLKDGGASWGDV